MELTLKITDAAELSKFGAFLSGLGSSENAEHVNGGVIPKAVKAVSKPLPAPAPVFDSPKTAPAEASAPAVTPQSEAKASSAAPAITLEQLRAAVGAKAKESDGAKREAVKALLSEYGASSVSTLASGHYADFLAKVEAL